jgi:hypothetical protein
MWHVGVTVICLLERQRVNTWKSSPVTVNNLMGASAMRSLVALKANALHLLRACTVNIIEVRCTELGSITNLREIELGNPSVYETSLSGQDIIGIFHRLNKSKTPIYQF